MRFSKTPCQKEFSHTLQLFSYDLFLSQVSPVQNMCKSHLNPNAGSCVYFFHSHLIHIGSFEFLKINFNLGFFFICHIEHPSLNCFTCKFHKHIFLFVLIQETD